MEQDIETLFMEHGETVSIELSYRMLLHDPDVIYFIESGDVDIFIMKPMGIFAEYEDEFFIEMSKKNNTFLGDLIAGPLNYLCNRVKGHLIFPFVLRKEDHPYRVICKANTKTTLRKIKAEQLWKLLKDDARAKNQYFDMTDQWLFHLSEVFTKYHISKNIFYLNEGTNEIKDEGLALVLPRHRQHENRALIAWMQIKSGAITPVGLECCVHNSESLMYPLTPVSWFEVWEPAIVKVVLGRPDITLEELNKAIIHYQQSIMCISKNIFVSTSELEIFDLSIKHLADRKRLEGTMKNLGALLGKHDYFKVSGAGDRLIEVCDIIGETIGKVFHRPKYSQAETVEEKIYEISVASKVHAREIYLKSNWWKQASTPLLVHIKKDFYEPAAAVPTREGTYELVFPESSSERHAVDNSLAGKMYHLATMFYRSFPRGTGFSLWQFLKFGTEGRGHGIALLCISGILSNLVGLFFPFFSQVLFDDVLPTSDLSLLGQLSFGIFVMAAAGAMFMVTREYTILRLETMITHDMEVAFWTRLIRLPLSFFRQYSVGDLFERLSSIKNIRQAVSGYTSRLIINAMFSFVYLFVMFYYSPILSLLGLFIIALSVVITIVSFRYGIGFQREIQELNGLLNGKILQIISGISKIRIYGVENRIFTYWAETLAQIKRLELKKSVINHVSRTMTVALPSLTALIVMTAVMYMFHSTGLQRVEGSLTLGNFMAFNAAFMMVSATYFSLSEAIIEMLHVVPTWERSRPIVDCPPEIRTDELLDIQITGQVEMTNVFFRYDKTSPFTHRNVTLKAEPGELIGVVGRAGCGKSTLIKMFLGFEKPERGGIFFDGKDINSLDLQQLRTQIGVVSQNCKVMDGTIQENITGGKLCHINEVMHVVRLAGLEELIEELPMGLRTYISHGQDTLSGGQLQRLFIARALINDPKILIFDEATNALDNKTQKNVSSNIEHLYVTRVVIAHRLSTVRNADRIYVMKDGTFVEVGHYDELMAKDGYFAQLVKLQEL